MRLVTVTSIGALVVSIAVLVFVLGLYSELEKSEPTDAVGNQPPSAIGNQPPSSQEICDSAAELWRNIKPSGDAAREIGAEIIKTQLAHACFK
jgi:hypothetical protein